MRRRDPSGRAASRRKCRRADWCRPAWRWYGSPDRYRAALQRPWTARRSDRALGSINLKTQSALIDANLTTLAHLAISSVTNLLNWAVVIGVDSTPKATRRDLNVALPPAATIAAASLATMSAGVPAGAVMPYQPAASEPGTEFPAARPAR